MPQPPVCMPITAWVNKWPQRRLCPGTFLSTVFRCKVKVLVSIPEGKRRIFIFKNVCVCVCTYTSRGRAIRPLTMTVSRGWDNRSPFFPNLVAV